MSNASSSKHASSRHSPSASSPATSKLPKFLQNKSTRDRSKSVGVDTGSTSSLASSGSGGKDGRGESNSPDLTSMSTPVPGAHIGGNKKKGSKFLGLRADRAKHDPDNDRERRGSSDSAASGAQSHSHSNSTTSYSTSSASNMSSTPTSPTGTDISDPPIIIEPPPRLSHPSPTPRNRTRSERPVSALVGSVSSSAGPSLFPSNSSSTSKMGDLPSRVTGWFSHAFSASSTDLSLPTILAQHHNNSRPPQLTQPPAVDTPSKRSNPLLAVAKHGKGHLDKAMRYLLDSDAVPDKSTEPIWLLGVLHTGWEPPQEEDVGKGSQHGHGKGLSSSVGPGGRSSTSTSPPPSSFRASTSSMEYTAHPLSTSLSSSMGNSRHSVNSSHFKEKEREKQPKEKDPGANWPPVFYADFTSRIWLTYRSHFGTPIKEGRLVDLPCIPSTGQGTASSANSMASSDVAVGSPTTVKRAWGWGGEKTWSSDTGWGCMLRTGQSLLANALIFHHLGRDWRRPPHPLHTADYATYVQILTWFLDTPSPDAPFSVHRMAASGKDLGTEVGNWFGPNTAAGAIRTLVNAFPECGLGVSVANDGTLFQSEVFAASHGDFGSRSPKKQHPKWGNRPVLILLPVRLGIDGVNPVYFETIRLLYTFPQSVGIAGGRPSSSYYFMGSQADNLFYLDPHHARPAIPLRPPPVVAKNEREMSSDSDRDSSSIRNRKQRSASTSYHHRAPTSPSSSRTGSSTFSYHAPMSPSPLQQQFSSSSADSSASYAASTYSHPRSTAQSHGYGRWNSSSQPGSPGTSEMDYRELGIVGSGLDPIQEHYVTAYSPAELKTFHCERVRKMAMSSLDPSMLIGFLCRDEIDWWDFKRRLGELPRTVISLQDEPPKWTTNFDEDDVGLESMSDELDMDMGDEDSGEQFFDTRSQSGSPSESSHRERSERSKSEEIDTEEDPVDPVTPGPNSKFSIIEISRSENGRKDDDKDIEFKPEDEEFNDDIEDDWVDPSVPTPSMLTPTPGAPYPYNSAPHATASSPPSESISAPPLKQRKSSSSKKGKKTKKQIPVPVPMVRLPSPPNQEHYPFPVTPADDPSVTPQDRSRTNSVSNNKDTTHRMHTARARDGGRTQSGGVKGILTDD